MDSDQTEAVIKQIRRERLDEVVTKVREVVLSDLRARGFFTPSQSEASYRSEIGTSISELISYMILWGYTASQAFVLFIEQGIGCDLPPYDGDPVSKLRGNYPFEWNEAEANVIIYG